MNHSYFLESDMSLMEAPERNLAFDLVRVTEAAALASARWLGRGDKNAGDGAAVDAMRLSFNSLPIAGKVVIGEGEKDEAPMLYNGEIKDHMHFCLFHEAAEKLDLCRKK